MLVRSHSPLHIPHWGTKSPSTGTTVTPRAGHGTNTRREAPKGRAVPTEQPVPKSSRTDQAAEKKGPCLDIPPPFPRTPTLGQPQGTAPPGAWAPSQAGIQRPLFSTTWTVRPQDPTKGPLWQLQQIRVRPEGSPATALPHPFPQSPQVQHTGYRGGMAMGRSHVQPAAGCG